MITKGQWFLRAGCYNHDYKVVAVSPTGQMMGVWGQPGAEVPIWSALDEDGGRHEIHAHDIGKPGIGSMRELPDELIGTDEDFRALEAKGVQAKIVRERDCAMAAAARAVEVAEMPGKYPFLTPIRAGKSSHAEGAANLRKYLALEFPGVKFSVRSKSYSGGDSIDVAWTDGPTDDQVDKIADKFQEADFCGMDDSTSYRDSVFADTFGGAKYVMCNRHATFAGVVAAWVAVGRDASDVAMDDRGHWDRWSSKFNDEMSRTWAQADLREVLK